MNKPTQLITKREDITLAQNKIKSAWLKLSEKIDDVHLGIKHADKRYSVYYLKELDAWTAFVELRSRYWNAFGLGRPNPANTSIIVEINFSYLGNRTVAGGIALAEDGSKYIVHSGRLGGNYSKKFFWDKFHGETIDVSGQKYAFISELDSESCLKNIAEFVSIVKGIKNIKK
jgi:5-methylcytosine-specific restriction protein B